MTLQDLKNEFNSTKGFPRSQVVAKVVKSCLALEALPLLRRALNDECVLVAIEAANGIGKLGPAALTCPAGKKRIRVGDAKADLLWQLLVIGGRTWSYSLFSNTYPVCLNAMLKLKADPETIFEYIHNHIGRGDGGEAIDSLKGLMELGTPDAKDLFHRAVQFWIPECGKVHAKKIQALAKRWP